MEQSKFKLEINIFSQNRSSFEGPWVDPVNYVTAHTLFLHPAYVKTLPVAFTLGVLLGCRMGWGLLLCLWKTLRDF